MRLVKQYQRYQELPEKRQQKMRAELEREIAKTNERLTKLGQPTISFDDLAAGLDSQTGTPASAPRKGFAGRSSLEAERRGDTVD